ncbi:MAG: SIMPL domain-containing protein [Pseudomonadota bacterium]
MVRGLTAALAALALTACTFEESRAQDHQVRSITVQGEGVVTAAPDIAILRFSVRTRGESAGDAFSANSNQMRSVVDVLKDQGIEPRDLQTDQISLSPVYDQNSRGYQDRTRIVAYEAMNSLTVRLRDIETAGAAIDAAVRAGANELQSFRMGFDNPKAMQDEARVAAVKDAKAKAEAMAEAAGASLGDVLTINASSDSSPQPMMMRAMAMESDMASPAPIEAGEQQVQVRVTAVFELQ